MINIKNVFVIGGGTAGHALPALQLSEELIKNNYKVIFITDTRMFKFVKTNISNKNIKVLCIKGRGIYRGSILKNIVSIYLIFYAFVQSLYYVNRFRPIISYGFGGGITIPPIIVSKIFKSQIILHEGNAVLGRANKFLYKYANILTTFFPVIDNNNFYKYQCVGMPVRKEIENIHNNKYVIKNDKLINILITGGSLGAEIMATQIAKAISSFPKKFKNKISIMQQVRKENYLYVEKLYTNSLNNFKLETYIENMPECLSWCHLVICRSGAGTIAENLISGKPAIMIPLPISMDNHQMKNALIIEKIGAGHVINETELNDQKKLTHKLQSIIFNSEGLFMMSKLAKENATLGTSVKLVNLGTKTLDRKH